MDVACENAPDSKPVWGLSVHRGSNPPISAELGRVAVSAGKRVPSEPGADARPRVNSGELRPYLAARRSPAVSPSIRPETRGSPPSGSNGDPVLTMEGYGVYERSRALSDGHKIPGNTSRSSGRGVDALPMAGRRPILQSSRGTAVSGRVIKRLGIHSTTSRRRYAPLVTGLQEQAESAGLVSALRREETE